MTKPLPVVGAERDTWGERLNDYLAELSATKGTSNLALGTTAGTALEASTTDTVMAAKVVPATATKNALDANYAALGGNGFVALGDSISTSGVSSAGAGFGDAWGAMVCMLSGQRLNYRGNGGVLGENSTEVRARVGAVIALGPQVVTVLAGTNDLSQGVTFAVWSANIKAIATGLRAAKIKVVLCTIPPRGVATYLATQLTWNRWLRAYAQANGYGLLDFFTLLVNPATGMFTTGYDSGDTVHPSQAAYVAMATYAAAQIVTPPYSPIQCVLGGALDTANIIANPTLSAGTPTPTSWYTGGIASADWTEGLVTDADFTGKAWEVAYTNAASASNFRSFDSYTVATGWSVGDVLLICARLKVVSATNVVPSVSAGLRFWVNFAAGGTIIPIAADGTVHPVGLAWFTVTVPAGATSVRLSTIVGAIPVGASFTARVGNFGVFNLTTGGYLTP